MIYHKDMNKSIITDQIDENLETACEKIRAAGFDWADIHNVFGKSVEDCTKEEAETIRNTLEKHGLKCGCVASTIFFMCPLNEEDEISLFKPEFKVHEGNLNDHLAALENACMVADVLDTSLIRVFPFRFPDNKEGATTEAEMDKIVHNLRLAADITEKHGKTLVLENCPYSRCPKGEMTMELTDRVNSPSLKLLWDPANSYRAVKKQVPDKYLTHDIYEEKELIADHIGWMHVKNYRDEGDRFAHVPLDEGDLDWKRLYFMDCALEPELEPGQVEGEMKLFSAL